MPIRVIRYLRQLSSTESHLLFWSALPLALFLFFVDLRLPLGVAGGIPYVAVVLLALWASEPRTPLAMSALCTVLIVLGGVLSPPGGSALQALTNRVLAIAAIWTVAVLAFYRRRAETERLEERRRAEEKLRHANRELEAFTRTLSHDLRGYLAPIISFADFLREEYGECLQHEGREIVAEIEAQGERMLNFLEDLLQLARAGHLGTPEAPVDAGEVVNEVLQDLEGDIGGSGMEVRKASLPPARVPETLLRQLFSNLIGNAVRYAGREGAPLEIGGECREDRVRYFVRDHGPGIPPGERERIFEVFHRGSTGQEHSGTGIGLATVRKIAHLYDGHAWVEETPGGGATFWVEVSDATPSPRDG